MKLKNSLHFIFYILMANTSPYPPTVNTWSQIIP